MKDAYVILDGNKLSQTYYYGRGKWGPRKDQALRYRCKKSADHAALLLDSNAYHVSEDATGKSVFIVDDLA
jgi:hypothetical protein